jgi:hypothetical protein
MMQRRLGGFKTSHIAIAVRLVQWLPLAGALFFLHPKTLGQIDPEKRRLIQLGYNQPLEGQGPIAGYGFFYYNKPQFIRTNWTMRLAVAPIYLDAELGVAELLGPNTDVGFGLAGGGFAETYPEIRGGDFRQSESFVGHGGEVSSSIYHRFNPNQMIPLWAVARLAVHASMYDTDSKTDSKFVLPEDRQSINVRAGLRYGGREPTLTTPLAMELSAWYEGHYRTDSTSYGFNNDRQVEAYTHLFWGRGLLKYTFGESEQYFDVALSLGASVKPDRFSAYRLGGMLPFASEFPLSIPGYFFQEISAERFALLNAQYSFPLEPSHSWNLSMFGAAARVAYLPGLEQPGAWNTGIGGGITYASRSRTWFATLVYGHGFQAIRHGERGADSVGLLFQYDFEAKKNGRAKPFNPGINPYSSRGTERLFQ